MTFSGWVKNMSEKGELVEQLGRRILGMWIIYRIISSTTLSILSFVAKAYIHNLSLSHLGCDNQPVFSLKIGALEREQR